MLSDVKIGSRAAREWGVVLTLVFMAGGATLLATRPIDSHGPAPALELENGGERRPAAANVVREPELNEPRAFDIVHTPPPVPVALSATGALPVYSRVPTKQKVIFVTIDDGATRTEFPIDLVRSSGIPVSLFLAEKWVNEDVGYFRRWTALGARVENHSLSHKKLTALSYEDQVAEICPPFADYRRIFGAAPTLFRPASGEFNNDTLRAVRACGMSALVHWRAVMSKGRLRVAGGGPLSPGVIVLMHFRPDLYLNLSNLLEITRAQGFAIARLESYLVASPSPVAPPSEESSTTEPTEEDPGL